MGDERVKEEFILIGWKRIHQLFCDQEGNQVISLSTLRQKYGPDLKRLGVVFRFHLGRGKRPTVCAYASQIKLYFTKLTQYKWKEEHPEE